MFRGEELVSSTCQVPLQENLVQVFLLRCHFVLFCFPCIPVPLFQGDNSPLGLFDLCGVEIFLQGCFKTTS